MTEIRKNTPEGRAYLGLQRAAREAGRPIAEYFRLYALEGFLLRLAHSAHSDRFVLKGGVLLAAHDLRRATADVDVAALAMSNEVEQMRKTIRNVAATALPDGLNDGLVFDLDAVTAAVIRDEHAYSAVRVRLPARLATANEVFHVDVNVGDPIWPAPAQIELPRLLGEKPIALRGYPLEMVVTEKIVTALERGVTSTRWRDFGDLYLLSGRHEFDAAAVRRSVEVVAEHRAVALSALSTELDGYDNIGQQGWAGWRRDRAQLEDTLPPSFTAVLDAANAFADPILTDAVTATARWHPIDRRWR